MSRDIVVQIIVRTGQGEVLACRRGPGSRFEQGKWNLPGGHLEMDESLEECAVRECHEETGVTIAKERLRFVGINSDPKDNPRQKVSVSYFAEVDDSQPTFADGDEISEVCWIEDVDSLDWAFPSQKALLKSIIKS
ncbi:NUDIX hydrolase [uncultured Duncaniella sp.]|uniref:NUDIX hydrolase n=1 Tax=uncultured Duncaniella sp. TaxID=2768039 RepID=UPI00260D29CD|nr:NUDIX hydrolase [uncultured Duncaniella sp.]